MTHPSSQPGNRSEAERLKESSDYLRGTIEAGLADPLTGAISEKDAQLLKFHGSYMQDDRDLRLERQKQKLEPAYQFMIRLRMPGGICTPAQWLQLDELAQKYANRSIRLTTRQTVQYHYVQKHHLKTIMRGFHAAGMTSIAACGDVNRNVLCTSNPQQSPVHEEAYRWAVRIDRHLRPHTGAYAEIWLGNKRVDGQEEIEPIYGKVYLPRKFKIGVVIPPQNDVDIFANDLGFIAIVENGGLAGFNVACGGGFGMTHGDSATYPRLASVIGYCPAEKIVEVAESVLKVQRDFGDRSNRKHARFKYTIDDRGLDWLKQELDRYLGWNLEPARPFAFESNGDRYGWIKGTDERWHLTLFIQNGRIKDWPDFQLMTALREVAKIHDGEFRITCNQNLIIWGVSTANKQVVDGLLEQYGVLDSRHRSGLRVNSMACVALPTCGLALAESERYLPTLVGKLEKIIADAGLENQPITIRMTGCPNGCARPYNAEIGLVGRSPGKYNLYLGGSFNGDRLNKLYKEAVGEEEIIAALSPIIRHYAEQREPGEHLGDFAIRQGYVKAVKEGRDFHL